MKYLKWKLSKIEVEKKTTRQNEWIEKVYSFDLLDIESGDKAIRLSNPLLIPARKHERLAWMNHDCLTLFLPFPGH